MKKIALFAIILSVFTSCTTEEPLNIHVDEHSTSTYSHVSLQEALQTADEAFKQIANPQTRSESRSVIQVDAILRSQTRSNDTTDTLMYVVNYSKGFAILGADHRLPPIFAISEDGQFNCDEDSNIGLKIILDRMRANSMWILDNYNSYATRSSSTQPRVEIIRYIPPMLSLRQNRIGSTNCSKYTLNSAGEPALSSCVPIATEMIMSYYKWPKVRYGYQFNWDEINAGNDEDGLARIIAILSDQKHCKLQNNTLESGGGAYYVNAKLSLRKCGYLTDELFSKFFDKEEEAIVALENGPLLMQADPSPESGFDSGHMWVIDGLYQYSMPIINSDYPIIGNNGNSTFLKRVYTLYHCVWGDYGYTNGYYLVSDHGFNGAPDWHEDIDSGDDRAAKYRDYLNSSVKFLRVIGLDSNYKDIY